MPLKPCRECGREISTNAASCPHCGEPAATEAAAAAEEDEDATEEPFKIEYLLPPAVIILIAWLFISGLGGGDSEGAEARAAARAADDVRFYGVMFCEREVRSQLVSPGTASFQGGTRHGRVVGSDSVFVSSWVDSQNRMGGTIRSDFACLAERTGGSGSDMRFRLLELEMAER